VPARSQRGSTLAETLVATAILTAVLGGALAVAIPATHRLSPDPRADALQRLAHRELAVARDLLKYDDAVVAPNAIATTMPLPDGTPEPVLLRVDVRAIAGATVVTVTAADDAHTARADAAIGARAAMPGATIAPDALVPAPTGAP